MRFENICWILGFLLILSFGLFLEFVFVESADVDKVFSSCIEDINGNFICDGLVYSCDKLIVNSSKIIEPIEEFEISEILDDVSYICQNYNLIGDISKDNFLGFNKTFKTDDVWSTVYVSKNVDNRNLNFVVDWGEDIGILVNKSIILINGSEEINVDESIISNLLAFDEVINYRLEAEFDYSSCDVLFDMFAYKLVHCRADPVVSLGVFSYEEYDVWEQYKSVWVGIFTNTQEDANGNITLTSSQVSGSFISNSYTNAEICYYGCIWDEIVWAGDDANLRNITENYTEWLVVDNFGDSSFDEQLWFQKKTGEACRIYETDWGAYGVVLILENSVSGTCSSEVWSNISMVRNPKNTDWRMDWLTSGGGGGNSFTVGISSATGSSSFDCSVDIWPYLRPSYQKINFTWLGTTLVIGNESATWQTCNGLIGPDYYLYVKYSTTTTGGVISNNADNQTWDEEISYVGVDACFSDDNSDFSNCQYNVTNGVDLGNDTAKYLRWKANFERTRTFASASNMITSAKLESVNITYTANPIIYSYGVYPIGGGIGTDFYIWANLSNKYDIEWCNISVDNPASPPLPYLMDENATSNDAYIFNSTTFKGNVTGVYNYNISCFSNLSKTSNVSGNFIVGDVQTPDLSLDYPIESITYSSSPNLNLYVKDDYALNWIKYTVNNWTTTNIIEEGISDFIINSSASYYNVSLGLADGSYYLILNASDTSGNINSSEVYFTIITPSPPSPPVAGGGGVDLPIMAIVPFCGDDICQGEYGENIASCSRDCATFARVKTGDLFKESIVISWIIYMLVFIALFSQIPTRVYSGIWGWFVGGYWQVVGYIKRKKS